MFSHHFEEENDEIFQANLQWSFSETEKKAENIFKAEE